MEPVYEWVVRDVETVKQSVDGLRTGENSAVTRWSARTIRTWSTRPWNDAGKQLPLVHHAKVDLEVEFRDFTALSRWLAAHIDGTGGFRVGHVEWALTTDRRDDLLRGVRTEAVKDAARRAQQYADALGLGEVRPIAIADSGMLGTASRAGGGYEIAPVGRAMSVGSAPRSNSSPRTSRSRRRLTRGLLSADAAAGGSVCIMAELKDRLRADLTAAMKSQDRLRTATLRMLLSAIQTEEVSGKESRELSDDDVIKVLARESRKRGEAAEIYTQNGRGELAANEHAEARIIDEYLPTPLTEAELADVVDTAIAQVTEDNGEAPGMKQMGQVMKAATAIAAGEADGARLSAAVKARL